MKLEKISKLLAGATLAAHVTKEGKVLMPDGSGYIEAFPDELTIGDRTFTLEEVTKVATGTKTDFYNAEYV